jgi:steroid delta-isomerase-like uncharacterized protein
MSLEENKATTYRFLDDIWSKGKLDVSKEILTPDFVFLLGVPPYKVEGPENFNQLVTRNRTAFQGLTYTADKEGTVAEGDKVVAPWTMTAKHVGAWAGFSPSNKDVSIQGMTHFRFANGKIKTAQVQNEALSLVRQVGGIPPAGEGTEYKVVEANKAHVRRYIEELLIKGNFAIANELVAPGFTIDRSAMPEAIAGPEGLHKQMDTLVKSFPDLELRIADLFAAGDKVVARFEAPGTHKFEFAGVPATGRKVMWKGIVIYHVVNNRVTHAWACWDDVGLIQSISKPAA